MSDLIERIHLAREAGHLLESSANNLLSMLEKSESQSVRDSVTELVAAEAWGELDDRFFRTLAFGTAACAAGPSASA